MGPLGRSELDVRWDHRLQVKFHFSVVNRGSGKLTVMIKYCYTFSPFSLLQKFIEATIEGDVQTELGLKHDPRFLVVIQKS